jgi:ABC-type sugar transport system ATPase subunit
VKALDGVSFEVAAGSVHAIVGENGALRPDGDSLSFEGNELQLRSTRDTAERGIAIVFQELNLAPNMTVAENISLGIEPPSLGMFVDRAAMRARAAGILGQLGIQLDLDARVGDLTIAQQQLIEICKSLVQTPRLLILDEPTSSLSESETNLLFGVIASLKAAGVTILYISHRMREVYAICDTVTILRDGKHVRTMPLATTDQDEIVRLMVGRDLAGIGRPSTRRGDRAVRPLSAQPVRRQSISEYLVRLATRRDRRAFRTRGRGPLGDGARPVRRTRTR